MSITQNEMSNARAIAKLNEKEFDNPLESMGLKDTFWYKGIIYHEEKNIDPVIFQYVNGACLGEKLVHQFDRHNVDITVFDEVEQHEIDETGIKPPDIFMGDDEFEEVYKSMKQFICDRYWPNMTPEGIEEMALAFDGGT